MTNGELRREDMDAGYPAYFAGFEAGATFAYREMAKEAEKFAAAATTVIRIGYGNFSRTWNCWRLCPRTIRRF